MTTARYLSRIFRVRLTANPYSFGNKIATSPLLPLRSIRTGQRTPYQGCGRTMFSTQSDDTDDTARIPAKGSESYVSRGTEFEELVVDSLRRFAFDIQRTGGPGDKGIDFRGTWQLPPELKVPVIGQCKFSSRRLKAMYIRELEGVLSHHAPGTLGLLISSVGFSEAATSYFQLPRSLPVMLGVVNSSGDLALLKLNAAAKALLPHLTLATRHVVTSSEEEGRQPGNEQAAHAHRHGTVPAHRLTKTVHLMYGGNRLLQSEAS
eukprot:TRINITY_DN17768_c0_g1_i1.p1 TRINITY_DN17768_c0_g1~~TRINITY_DN17768_c0_g1_i1.p1  ORF type:complete len:263 (+),score=8.48 TRINITY_DN17768_c0_g1_i1:194-982(+)